MRPILCFALTILTSSFLWADCTTSREFEITRAQKLGAQLLDPSGAVIPGWRIVLLQQKKTVDETRSDVEGRFSFDPVPAGKYRLRMEQKEFCAPQVYCSADGVCKIDGKVKLNPKLVIEHVV